MKRNMTTFESIPLPSGSPMYFGHLSWKPSFLSPRSGVLVFLAHPLEIMDVKMIHDSVMSKSLVDPRTEPADLTLYGHVSLSAISGFPILILSNGRKLTVVHFSQVEAIRDEVELELACSFALATGSAQYKFSAETSIDYQYWIRVLHQAFDDMMCSPNFNESQLSFNRAIGMGPHHQGERGILMETPPMESNEDLTPEDAHLSFLSSLEEQQPVAAMEREADVEDEEEEDNIPLGKSMPSPEDNIPLGESMPSPVLSQGIDDIIREGSSPVSVAPPAVPQKTESHQGTFPTPDPSVNQSSDSPFDLLPTSKRRLSGQTHTEVTYQEEPVYPFDSTFSRYMSRRSVDGYRFATAPSPQVTPPKPKSTNVFKGAFKKVSKWLNADEHEHVYHPAALAYDVYHPLHHQR